MQTASAKQIWEAALGELQIQVSKANYHTWLEKTVGLDLQNNTFTIGVPNTFVAEYLEKNQRDLIEKVITNLVGPGVDLDFQLHTDSSPFARVARTRPVSTQQASLPLFNPKYTFDSFIVGTCNHLAYAASLGVAQNPGKGYNPLFIYGGAGLGKTHLLQAIGQAAALSSFKVLYVSAEKYTNELMTALRDKKTEEFRSRYRSVDMLLIDDVQFFSGKAHTEETFFHTFDELHNSNHQIAMTSDRSPNAIPMLKERLRSRFEWGLVTDLQPPDFETRLAILKAKAKREGMSVQNDILEFVAVRVQQNIRALEGALNRVVAYAKLTQSRITTQLVGEALRDIGTTEPRPAQITPGMVIEEVVKGFDLTPSDLKGRKRDEVTALARQVAMYIMRQETNCSLAEVGRELGGRSAATVTHAYQKVAGDINNSPTLRRKVFEIQQNIRNVARSGEKDNVNTR